MSLNHSPSVVTNGLVMYYDMNNTQKSWKGAPATNLAVTVPYGSDVYTACSGPVNAVAVDATGQSRTVNRYTINTTGGTPRARIVATGLTAGVNYSYSVKIRYNGGVYPQTWYIDTSKGNPEGGVNNNTYTSYTTNSVSLGNGWYQLTANFNYATCPTGGAWSNFGLVAPDATYLNQTFDAYDIQFEQNTYATPYIAGTRANTGAIVDLTSNNTITATSLTYASDGTFNFAGSSYANVNYNSMLDLINTVSLCAWVKYTASTNVACIEKSNNNTHYQLQIFSSAQGSGLGGELVFMLQPNASNWVTATVASNDNNWHYVVGTYDRTSTTAKIYIDGVLKNTNAAITTGPISNTSDLLIGSRSGTAAGMGGSIPVVKVYNRVLTAAEVARNFNALRGRYSL